MSDSDEGIRYRHLSPVQMAAELAQMLRDNPPKTEDQVLRERAERNRRLAELMKQEITI